MNKIRITVMAKACHPELSRLYENPIEHAFDLNISDVFVSEVWLRLFLLFLMVLRISIRGG